MSGEENRKTECWNAMSPDPRRSRDFLFARDGEARRSTVQSPRPVAAVGGPGRSIGGRIRRRRRQTPRRPNENSGFLRRLRHLRKLRGGSVLHCPERGVGGPRVLVLPLSGCGITDLAAEWGGGGGLSGEKAEKPSTGTAGVPTHRRVGFFFCASGVRRYRRLNRPRPSEFRRFTFRALPAL